jgi:hypothetical protein
MLTNPCALLGKIISESYRIGAWKHSRSLHRDRYILAEAELALQSAGTMQPFETLSLPLLQPICRKAWLRIHFRPWCNVFYVEKGLEHMAPHESYWWIQPHQWGKTA